MASLPAPIRATLGLLATALDAVQELKEHAPEIPMEAVGNSMQLSMRLQQQYVALLNRGDEFLATLRGAPEEPPAWATFDESPPAAHDADLADDADLTVAADPTGDPDLPAAELPGYADLSDDAVGDLPEAEIPDGPRHGGQGDPLLAAATRSRTAAATVAQPAKKAAKKAAKATAAKAAATKTAKKTAATKTAAKKAAAAKAPGKKVSAVTAVPPTKVAGVKATAAKQTPALTAASTRRAVKTAAALDSAEPILPPPSGPAKRGRPGRKTGPRKAVAEPRLDASLILGEPSARPQSAFDLAEPSPDATSPDTSATDTSSAEAGLDALLATAATEITASGTGPSDPGSIRPTPDDA